MAGYIARIAKLKAAYLAIFGYWIRVSVKTEETPYNGQEKLCG